MVDKVASLMNVKNQRIWGMGRKSNEKESRNSESSTGAGPLPEPEEIEPEAAGRGAPAHRPDLKLEKTV